MKEQNHWWTRAGEKARDAWEKRKSDIVVKRRSQQEEIVPVLLTMPWNEIVAGRARIRNIEAFIRYYEMYVPLLALGRDTLIEARDSGIFKGFDLYASADTIVVEGIRPDGVKVTVVVITGNYWEDLYTYKPHNYIPW